jgi:hypothetical protein
MKDIISGIERLKTVSPQTWDPDATFALLSEVYQREIDNINMLCGSAYVTAWKPDVTLDYSKPTKNIIGQLLYTTSITDLNSLNVQRCTIEGMTNKVLSFTAKSK